MGSRQNGGHMTGKWLVPADFQCPSGQAVGRWLWKTGNSCNDINNVGRPTMRFSFEEFRAVVEAYAPNEHVQAPCVAPPEVFISCFDFLVNGEVPPTTPEPEPETTTPEPEPEPETTTPEPEPEPEPTP